MEWYYEQAGQVRGPVTGATLRRLRSLGDLNAETLVWRAGLSGWLPCRELEAEWEAGLTDGGAGEGILGSPVDVLGCLREAWGIYRKAPGSLIWPTLMVLLMSLAVQLVPLVGGLASVVLNGPLVAGLWLVYIRKVRGEEPGLAETFVGFGPGFGQLVLVNVVPTALALVLMLPALVALAIGIVPTCLAHLGEPPLRMLAAVPAHNWWLFAGLALLGNLGILWILVSWLFGLPLVIDRRLGFWAALQMSNRAARGRRLGLCLVLLLCTALMALGTLLCLVGFFFTAPIAFGTLAVLYQRWFGDPPRPA